MTWQQTDTESLVSTSVTAGNDVCFRCYPPWILTLIRNLKLWPVNYKISRTFAIRRRARIQVSRCESLAAVTCPAGRCEDQLSRFAFKGIRTIAVQACSLLQPWRCRQQTSSKRWYPLVNYTASQSSTPVVLEFESETPHGKRNADP